jgi:multidrug efflux system membrane fusion protein
VTGIRQVDAGNIVRPTDTNGIVVVTQIDPIAVIFSLPQDELPRVNAALAAGDVKVEALSRDGATTLGEGTLALVDNQVNATTATIRLKAMMPNPDKKLWPNLFVKARARLSIQEGATVVPSVAVQRGPQGTFVYVLQPGDTVVNRPITVAWAQGDISILTSGVKPGEHVVTDGANQLRPGSKVSVKAPPKGKASASAGPR